MNNNMAQAQNLTPEQQDALGRLVIQRDKMRQRLLKERGHYPAMAWLPCVGMVPLILVPTLAQSFTTNPIYVALSVAVSAFIAFFSLQIFIAHHADGINRRIDALIELMKDDHTG
jgi:low affinity Fe/Cu permease